VPQIIIAFFFLEGFLAAAKVLRFINYAHINKNMIFCPIHKKENNLYNSIVQGHCIENTF
jgi:hypothetical protein